MNAIEIQIEKIINEGAIGMAEAAKLPGTFRRGRPCHPSTLTRWCLDGVKLPNGQTIHLEHYRQAGRIMTSRAALLRFLVAQQDQASIASANAPRSPGERERAANKAGKELEALGV